jgi:hypothetical protein
VTIFFPNICDWRRISENGRKRNVTLSVTVRVVRKYLAKHPIEGESAATSSQDIEKDSCQVHAGSVEGNLVSEKKRIVFQRRIDEHGFFESTCPACFEVVARQMSESALEAYEESHQCNELILNDVLDFFRDVPVPQPGKTHRQMLAFLRGKNIRRQ